MTLRSFKNKCLTTLSTIFPNSEIETFFYYLLEDYLNLKRIEYSLQPDTSIDEQTLEKLESALKRLEQQEPIQYILGHTEFFGLPFKVDKNVLIPRSETEELVNWILEDLQSNSYQSPIHIVDLGTGSGCIPVSLQKNLHHANITAVDLSEEALMIAKTNAQNNAVTIDYIQGDLLTPKSLASRFETAFDIIVSNPPYVRALEKEDMKNNILDYEPHLALFVSDDDPLLFYNAIADFALQKLNPKGALYLEINQYLGKETKALLLDKGFKTVVLKKDFVGNDRMIKATFS